MDIEQLDKKILDLVKEGKSTKEIALLLNGEGIRTPSGDIFLRKSVNNRLTKMRAQGLLGSKKKASQRLTYVKPHLYVSDNGKYRVRKAMSGKMVHETFDSQEAAEKFLADLGVVDPTRLDVKELPIAKKEPRITKIEIPSYMSEDSNEYSLSIHTFKGQAAKDMVRELAASLRREIHG